MLFPIVGIVSSPRAPAANAARGEYKPIIQTQNLSTKYCPFDRPP